MPLMNVPNDVLAELRKLDPDFNAFMNGENAPLEKDATAGDVHVPSTSKKKPPATPDFEQSMNDADETSLADKVAKGSTFADVLADANSITKAEARSLKPHPDGGAHVPFPHDPNALGKIPPDQTRKFLTALTSPDELEQRRVPMKSLVSLQPRISAEKTQSMRDNGFGKLPTVIRHDGKNYIADGNHRAAAQWLDGDNMLDCKFCALRGDDETLAKSEFGFHILNKSDDGVDWEFTFEVAKADADQQLIFGWASIVQEGDHLVVDHQNDMILPEDLEKGVYDFVLEARAHGDSHKTIGTGRLVESMMFTKEKQAALGVTLKNDQGQQIVGWWAGFKVDSADVWARHKSGDLPEFSIGGHSTSTAM